ncbi:hypothetical protein ACFE04_008378 [Oxalis oulophora]
MDYSTSMRSLKKKVKNNASGDPVRFEALKLPFASLPFYVPAPSFREDQSAPVDTNYHLAMGRQCPVFSIFSKVTAVVDVRSFNSQPRNVPDLRTEPKERAKGLQYYRQVRRVAVVQAFPLLSSLLKALCPAYQNRFHLWDFGEPLNNEVRHLRREGRRKVGSALKEDVPGGKVRSMSSVPIIALSTLGRRQTKSKPRACPSKKTDALTRNGFRASALNQSVASFLIPSAITWSIWVGLTPWLGYGYHSRVTLLPLIDKQGVLSPNSSCTDETREFFRRDKGKQSFNEIRKSRLYFLCGSVSLGTVIPVWLSTNIRMEIGTDNSDGDEASEKITAECTLAGDRQYTISEVVGYPERSSCPVPGRILERLKPPVDPRSAKKQGPIQTRALIEIEGQRTSTELRKVYRKDQSRRQGYDIGSEARVGVASRIREGAKRHPDSLSCRTILSLLNEGTEHNET